MPLEGRRPIRVAIVNDYPVVVVGMATLLARYKTRVELRELAANDRLTQDVDVILYDMFAQQEDVLTIPPVLKPKPAGVKVIFFGWTSDVAVIQHGMKHGVDGYIHKSLPPPRIVESIQRIFRGEHLMVLGERREDGGEASAVGAWPGKKEGLTYRESTVMALIVSTGMNNADIGATLYITLNTVKTIVKHIYRKTGVSNRGEAVAWGNAHGFAPQKKYRIVYPDNTEGVVP